jgi:hypothetical protein
VSRGFANLEYAGADGTTAYFIHLPDSFRKDSVSDCHI